MRYQQLKYFVEVCHTCSLNQAAKNLHTSQPNISKTIAQLEEELGETLFIRTPTGTYPTAYGKKICHHAEQAIADIERIYKSKLEIPNHTLSLAIESSCWGGNLAGLYAKENPQLNLNYFQGARDLVVKRVLSYQADLGLIFIPENLQASLMEKVGSQGLSAQLIRTCSLAVFTANESELAKREHCQLIDLRGRSFVGRPHDFYAYEHQLHWVSDGALNEKDLQQDYYSEDASVSQYLIAAGLAEALDVQIPISLAEVGISQVPISDCPNFLGIVCIRQAKNQGQKRTEDFVDFLRDL